jgi:Asp/Glu/hydantoin racemase
MKRIACIHTVYSVIDSFTKQLREGIPGEFLIHTVYDDFLATDPSPAQAGKFTAINHQRLRLDMQTQALTGADVIVVTCSTLSPSVRLLRNEFNVPVVAIDDAMVQEAVATGTKIGLMATATSTVEPSASAIRAAAAAMGKEIDLKVLCNEQAILALKAGDPATHDRLVLEMADQMKDRDVIVLAQASTAYMEQPVAERSGVTTLSSPARCIAQLRKMLEEM